jgi:hypothetical protein
MTKTLGQVAYEAYWALVAAEREMEDSADWNALPAGWPGQKAWQAAAEAVVEAQRRPYGGDEQTEWLERLGKERAVIEAARRLRAAGSGYLARHVRDVARAVAALEEERDE